MNGSISRRGLSLGLLTSACALRLGAAAVPASAAARPFTMFRRPADLKRSSGTAAASRMPLDRYMPPDPDDDYEPGVPYDFQILQLEADTVVGTGDGDYAGRLHIRFSGDNGYLLIAPPLGAGVFRARIEIETNAAVVVIIGNDFVPQGHKIHDPYYPPSEPWIVKDMLQIFFQGRTSARNPACYILRCRTTSFENGNPYYEAGGPLEVSGDEDDPAEWPLLYVDNSWFDAWYGWFGSNSGHTQGHMNWIKGVPGTLGGLRVAGCRVKTNYLFVLGNDWGMEEHGPINEAWATFEIRDTQFVRAQHPADYDGGTIYDNTIYHHTSYDPATLSGGYHPFVYVGGPSGGPDGFGFWVDIGEQPAFTHIGDMVQPPVGYGVAIDGPNLVSDGKPPVSSRRSADNLPLVVGTIWAGTHPKTGDLTERCRPVMRHEAGAAYAVRTKAELKAYIARTGSADTSRPNDWLDPPTLVRPIRIDVRADGSVTVNGAPDTRITSRSGYDASGADVRITWPSTTVTGLGTMTINNANNVVCMAGAWKPSLSTAAALMFNFDDLRGTLHIERMDVDLSNREWTGAADDGAPAGYSGDWLRWGGGTTYPNLVLQGVKVVGVRGSAPTGGNHADIVQQETRCGSVYIRDIEFGSNYQTLLWVPLTFSLTATRSTDYWNMTRLYLIATDGREESASATPLYLKSGSHISTSQMFDLRIQRDTLYVLNNSDSMNPEYLFNPPFGTQVWYQPREISAGVYEMPSVSGNLSFGIGDTGARWDPNGSTGWGMESVDAAAFAGDRDYVAATAIIGRPPGGTYTPAAMIGPDSTDYAP